MNFCEKNGRVYYGSDKQRFIYGGTYENRIKDYFYLTDLGSTVEMVTLSVVLFVLEGALGIISGALGLRAARNPEKSMLAVIWGGLTLALSVFSLATEPSVQQLFSCIIPLLYFIFAMNVRKSRK